jgi:putative membrane protein
MAGYEGFCGGLGWWWIFPFLMIALCFLMARRGSTLCGLGFRGAESQSLNPLDSAMEILDKRYALGEINQEEYEAKKGALRQRN